MKPAVPVGTERSARTPVAATRAALPRVLVAVVPVATLGMLAFVPSLVIALRRRRAADWLVCAGFTAVAVAWCAWAALSPVETHGTGFALDLLLLLGATLGAAAHALFGWHTPERTGHDAKATA
ncbi:hypothetical protein [Streptomyces sp. B1I3]|uniref:hypothetical protein n=1 Tax=Streptomyces sp. B1I3 TaxID=3042264 RepID=UPI0027D833ED|nr:hypothetical protein [Streptomyces sp. B1I3]